MNHRDPVLQEKLAAEYVTGALRGGARRRFERWMRDDAALRREVAEWEERLYPLAMSLPPEPPPGRVWRAIKRRVRALQPVSPWGWSGLYLWRACTAALAVLLVAGMFVYPAQVERAAQTRFMALLKDNRAQVALVVTAGQNGQLRIHAVSDLSPSAQAKALELWALPQGGAPQSLVLVSPQGGTILLRHGGLAGVPALAISVEPPGGSPTGLPTGPVILSGKVLNI